MEGVGRSESVAGSASVDVGQHVDGALLQGPTQGDELAQRLRHRVAERIDQLLERHRSKASPARRTTWNGSITTTASGSSSTVAVLNPVNRPSR
jgi:hypothetical protein